MNGNKINKFNTLRWKAVMAASIGAIILAASIVIIQDHFLLSRINDYSKLSSNMRTDSYMSDFESQLNKTVIKIQTEAETISEQTTQNRPSTKEITQGMMERFLNNDKSVKSVFVISEPYIFDNSDSLLVNTNPGFPIGWYEKRIRHENMGSNERSSDLQSTSAEIYDKYREIKHDLTPKVISLKQNGDVSNVIVVMVPFFTKNKFSGIIGVDIDQMYYRNILDEQIPTNTTIYIADSTGNIFYSRNKDYQNRNINDVIRFTEEKYNILSRTAQNLPVNEECEIVENNNEPVYLHTMRIAVPCCDDNFTMICITPIEQIKSEKEGALLMTILSIMGVLAAFITFIIIVSKQLTKPIQKVRDKITTLCNGNFAAYDTQDTESGSDNMPEEWREMVDSIKTMADTLKETAQFANDIREKKFDQTYSDRVSSNAIGLALTSLRENLQKTAEMEKIRFDEEQQSQWATKGHSMFSDILRNNISDIRKLCNAVMDSLVPYINVNQGGIFIRTTMPDNDSEECFELYAVFAYGHQRFHKRTLKLDEGMIGACAMEQQTIILNNIPEDYTDISSGLGTAKPKCIMFVPLKYNDYLYGVMEFASFQTFEQYQIQFVERISDNIASTIANAKISEQTTLLLKKARQQAQQMEEKEDQLKGEIESLNSLVSTTQNELSEIEQVNNAMNKTLLVAIFSTKGDTINANRKFALRYTLDINDIRRKNVYEILQLNLSKYDEFKKMWDSVKQGTTETYNIEFKINNTVRKIRNVFVPVANAENQTDRILCIATDITGQQTMEEELAKLKKQSKEHQLETDALRKALSNKEEEIAIINNELVATKRDNAESRSKIEKANTSAQFYKKELEKRIGKSRKIENTLKEKVKAKDEEIAKLRDLLDLNYDDEEDQDPGNEN